MIKIKKRQKKKIVVYANNLTGAGSLSIGINILPLIVENMSDFQFLLMLPETEFFRSILFCKNSVQIFFPIKHGIRNNIVRINELLWHASNLVNNAHADVCLTLGDLMPQMLKCPNVLFFQQALLLYKNSELGGRGSWSLFKRIFLWVYFYLTATKNSKIIVQTPVMAERLTKRFKVLPNKISVVQQPVPQDISYELESSKPLSHIAKNKKPIKLLFLATYYPHKNHKILPKVVEELKKRQMVDKVHIFTTIEVGGAFNKNSYNNLFCYPEIITNVGKLSSLEVAQAYRASTALFAPTLAESYGLTYLEAMLFGIPILTSDRDFSHYMCGNAAIYFDPMNSISIVDSIMKLEKINISSYQKTAAENLKRFPKNWSIVADKFSNIIRDSICE